MFVSTVVARFALLTALLAAPLSAGAALTLTEAERLALERAPGLERARATVAASTERVLYEGRLPDPQLTTGFVNVPTDSYNLRQEDMTMTMLGVRQSFPPGDTLNLRSRRAEKEFTREEARLETDRMIEGRKRFKGVLAGYEDGNVLIDLDGEEETALIPFDWLSDAKLVLTDALMKRGAAIRAARGEPEDDGLPEGEAAEDTTDTTTPSEDNA